MKIFILNSVMETIHKLFKNQLKRNSYLHNIMLYPHWTRGLESGWMDGWMDGWFRWRHHLL